MGDPERDAPAFVVQKHQASTLHFDLRLEVDGVLVSWAVPKGPSTDPAVKRLAVRVDDHAMSHLDVEGVLGAGPGAGTVVVWDLGTYRDDTRRDGRTVPTADALEAGHVRVRLEGRRLHGAWALTHTRMGGLERNWLLVKVDDDGADRDRDLVADEPGSVLTGRTNDDLARGVDAV
ncbi:MAG: DNA polymerase ligase N-terminal domain-containing protein [Nocardioidaceae bacterium]|nr:DNA polymerase ligase N-terminal domain-containing protein [Nocardioidaceae bacterium]